ncbi:hypothetical protein M3J09_010149 [Ascochyta lentis]
MNARSQASSRICRTWIHRGRTRGDIITTHLIGLVTRSAKRHIEKCLACRRLSGLGMSYMSTAPAPGVITSRDINPQRSCRSSLALCQINSPPFQRRLACCCLCTGSCG